MSTQRLWTRDYLSICFCCLFIFITYYALIATLPMFVLEVLKGGNEQIGLVMTSLIIAAILVRPFAGKWLDELGRKKILMAALSLFLISAISYLGIQSFFLLIALRFLHGLGFGAVTTAMVTIVADITPDRRKGEGIGYYAMFMNLAMVIGPFLGLTLADEFGFSVLFGALSFCSLLAFLCGCLIRIPIFTSSRETTKSFPFHWKEFIEPKAASISFIALLLAVGYSGVLTFIPIYAKEMDMVQAASYFFPVYAVMIVLSRPFTARWFDRYSEHTIVYPSIILFVIGLICLSLAHHPLLFLVAAGLIGLGFGTGFSFLQVIAIRRTPVANRGKANSTYLIFFDIGVGAGSYVLGTVASFLGYQNMYLLSSIIVTSSILFYYGMFHRRGTKKIDHIQEGQGEIPLTQNN